MNKESQRIAIAEACGWKLLDHGDMCFTLVSPNGQRCGCNKSSMEGAFALLKLPDYLNDLNAMHEAEKVLTPDQKTDYIRLINKGDFSCRRLAFATAAQRAEAFLRTLGLWKDDASHLSMVASRTASINKKE